MGSVESVTKYNGHRRSRRTLGQHFLRDTSYVQPILEAANLGPEEVVIEVGPGKGVLTGELAYRVRKVMSIEIDPVLVNQLRRRFHHVSNLEVVEGDARSFDFADLLRDDEPYKVVANLPFYAASLIIRHFLEASHKPQLLVVMVQREVALQMVAAPGKMSLQSVGVQYYGIPRIVTLVPPSAFSPSPKVTSAVVAIQVRDGPLVEVDSAENFFRLVRGGFSAPRKQLRNALSLGLGISGSVCSTLLQNAGILHNRRAETLAIEEWATLYRTWRWHNDV